MSDPVFWACAAVSLVSALMVVTRRNPVYSALWLMQAFLAFAVLFFNLGATFAGAMHILVYTGAILVLFLFVIMLLNLRPEELGTEMSLVPKAFMALCCAAVAGCLAWSGWQQFRHDKEHLGAMASFEKRSVDREPMYRCLRHPRGMVRIEPGRCTERLPDGGTCGAEMRSLGDWGGVRHLGWELFHRHALAFEILSLLIIIAIFGGVVLAKRRL